jgi:hypothetical protein
VILIMATPDTDAAIVAEYGDEADDGGARP